MWWRPTAVSHGQETEAWGDAGYQGRSELERRHAPGPSSALDKNDARQRLIDQIERIKARIRAKVEHPFRVVKRQFGHVKVRCRGLAKNTAQLHTLFALANL